MSRLAEWIARTHERSHERTPGTYGPSDLGCHAGCTSICDPAPDVGGLADLARHIHASLGHPGPVEACQSPHDVICKAIDWRHL